MNKEKLLRQLISEYDSKIRFLPDKPEETLESTLRACWFTAAGHPKSAKKSMEVALPELTDAQVITLFDLVNKRLENIPLAHITGRQNFMGVELLSDERALIPRKETEILGKKALEISYSIKNKKPVKVMDVCCGAGNLGLALAFYNQNIEVLCTDLSNDAIELTLKNSAFLNLNNRVRAKAGDLFTPFNEIEWYNTIDLIVCNPPYISTAKVSKMTSEISRHEPVLAFDGGMFGTKIIQKLIVEAPKFLIKGGWLLFEVGLGQGDFILRLCEDSNHYEDLSSVTDAEGNIRVILARKK